MLHSELPISIGWRGSELLAVYHKPKHLRAQTPGIIYVHGIPGDRIDSRRLTVRIARHLQQLGFFGLRADLFASGVSDGEYHELTYHQQISQLSSILNHIEEKQLWCGPTYVVAFSEGAKIALQVAKQDQRLRAICLCNGIFASENRPAGDRLIRLYRKGEELVFDMGYGVWINRKVILEGSELSINSRTEFPDIPIYGIYGSCDPLTSSSLQVLQQCGFEVDVVAGADHLYTEARWESVLIESMANWLMRAAKC